MLRAFMLILLSALFLGSNAFVSAQSNQREVTGTVVDAKGESLPGATVIIKGTSTGVIADLDGKFSLDVPDEASVLVVSFVGYKSQEINIGNQTIFEVSLESSFELSSVDHNLDADHLKILVGVADGDR